VATFSDSSAVEARIANVLLEAAASLEGGKDPMAVLEEDTVELQVLVNRRIEIQTRRLQLLAP